MMEQSDSEAELWLKEAGNVIEMRMGSLREPAFDRMEVEPTNADWCAQHEPGLYSAIEFEIQEWLKTAAEADMMYRLRRLREADLI